MTDLMSEAGVHWKRFQWYCRCWTI